MCSEPGQQSHWAKPFPFRSEESPTLTVTCQKSRVMVTEYQLFAILLISFRSLTCPWKLGNQYRISQSHWSLVTPTHTVRHLIWPQTMTIGQALSCSNYSLVICPLSLAVSLGHMLRVHLLSWWLSPFSESTLLLSQSLPGSLSRVTENLPTSISQSQALTFYWPINLGSRVTECHLVYMRIFSLGATRYWGPIFSILIHSSNRPSPALTQILKD